MKYTIACFMILIISFAGCKTDKKATLEHDIKLLEQGQEITALTFQALATELQGVMQKGGVAGAVQYCNLEAMPITDSLSAKYNVKIKRTSGKTRNPFNKPNVEEQHYLNVYKNQLESGMKLSPKLIKKEATKFYAPIMVNDFCLKCHGLKSEIKDYESIANLYPFDKATGYSAGDLRGMWSVTFLE